MHYYKHHCNLKGHESVLYKAAAEFDPSTFQSKVDDLDNRTMDCLVSFIKRLEHLNTKHLFMDYFGRFGVHFQQCLKTWVTRFSF